MLSIGCAECVKYYFSIPVDLFDPLINNDATVLNMLFDVDDKVDDVAFVSTLLTSCVAGMLILISPWCVLPLYILAPLFARSAAYAADGYVVIVVDDKRKEDGGAVVASIASAELSWWCVLLRKQ